MKKEYYVDSICVDDIIRAEEYLFELYQSVILTFEKAFFVYNCNIRIMNCWTTDKFKSVTNIRPDLQQKYAYWICYEVCNNEEPVIYDDENSLLTRSYVALIVSTIKKRHKSKILVEVFDDLDDVAEDLEEDLNKIKKLFDKKIKLD